MANAFVVKALPAKLLAPMGNVCNAEQKMIVHQDNNVRPQIHV